MVSRRKTLLVILGLAISAGAVTMLAIKIDLAATWSVLVSLDGRYLVVMAVIYLLTFVFRGLRWHLMLRRTGDVTLATSTNGVVYGFAGNNLLPARAGELVRMEYLSRNSSVPRVSSLSSIVAERVMDGLILLAVLLISLLFARQQMLSKPWVLEMIGVVSLLFGSAFLVLAAISLFGRSLVSYFEKKSPSRLVVALIGIVRKVYEALAFFKNDAAFYGIIILGGVVWVLEGAVFVLGLGAVGLPMNLLAGFVALAVVNFGLVLPSSPAFIGVFQGMTVLALALFGISNEQALSVSILVHACQVFPVLVLAFVLMLWDLKRGRSVRASSVWKGT